MKAINTMMELLTEYQVEIPIIQRDYAQGRLDSHSVTVRSILLNDMKNAILKDTPPLDLNFVYGKFENNIFIPIDGQQRLTTLYLLHLFAFAYDCSKDEILKRFTYETRISSRVFFEKVVKYRNTIFSSIKLPSTEIKDKEWFQSNWMLDPTIQSTLTMLDDISLKFSDIEDLAQKLTDEHYKPIMFGFLEMQNLGMEDSLYIKLNARGRPLTAIENFKASLIDRIQKIKLSFSQDFERNFDTIWTDLFWSKSKDKFDSMFYKFFGVLLMNNSIISDDSKTDTLDYDKITIKALESMYYSLNYLSKNPNIIECKFVFRALEDRSTYIDKIVFHSITEYLCFNKGVGGESLSKWFRIIKNLAVNSQIDVVDNYKRAVAEVTKLSENCNNFLVWFANNGKKVSVFSTEQINEEIIKANNMLKDKTFEEAIINAERNNYFSGQIRSALYYSSYYNNAGDVKAFNLYWKKIELLFDDNKPIYGHLFRRALLTFGDYTLKVGEYKTLCVDDPNETSRTPSFKSLFSEHGKYLKIFLDSLDSDKDIKPQLEAFIKKSTVKENDWRYCFINYPELFGYMSVSHLRLRASGNEMLIIPNKSSSGYNYDIYLAALCSHFKIDRWIANMGEYGTCGNRYMDYKKVKVKNYNGKLTIYKNNILSEEQGDNLLTKTISYLSGI